MLMVVEYSLLRSYQLQIEPLRQTKNVCEGIRHAPRIPIAHLVLYELGTTMYSSTDWLDAFSNSHHGGTDHGAA
jgi:hypothetical protein